MGNRAGIFFLVFFLSVASCASQQPPETDFYEGLKEQRDGDQSKAIACFEKALYASNSSIAAAAAVELMRLHSAGTELTPTIIITIQQVIDAAAGTTAGKAAGKVAGPWAKVFDAMDAAESAAGSAIEKASFEEAHFAKALALLLDGENRLPDEAVRYALQRWRSADNDAVDFFTEAENAAIDGHLAVSRSRYNEALIFFRIALRDSPDLFFRYPSLLNDLGRTFQYTTTRLEAGIEGKDLFLKWEQDAAMFATVPSGSEDLVRFRLLFFAGRIARQRKEPHIALFEQALPFAPESPVSQSDACIWYILDSALAQSPGTAIRYLETYISRWQDDTYFADIMDKLTRELVFRRQWNDLLNVFALLQNRPFAVKAQYAWIIGRAMEEGLFSPEEIIRANAMLPGKIVSAQESARAYMRIAYNTEKALYYRSLSAAALGETFLSSTKMPEKSATTAKGKAAKDKSVKNNAKGNGDGSDTLRFLLGFFEHDAAEFAPRYIRLMESDLSPEELRRLAQALGESGNYQESMRIVSLYTRQKEYQTQRRDWELLYPQPYRELVERYAQEANIDPALLFGLIRTESAFNSGIVSHAGAIGLTQLMPATAQEFVARIRRQGGPDYTDASATDADAAYLRDPAVNIHIGAAYLAYLNERMGDPLLALLAYNGGMNRVRRWRNASNSPASSLPTDLFLETVEYPETREYGRSVLAAQAMYRGLYYK